MAKKRRPSILVVEDDASGRAMLGLVLRQAGYRVQSAADGMQALKLLRKGCFDWMITDGRMEPIDGFTLSQQAKRLCPDLRILMISAIHTSRDIQNYPIETLFCKPFPAENLLAWLSSARHAA